MLGPIPSKLRERPSVPRHVGSPTLLRPSTLAANPFLLICCSARPLAQSGCRELIFKTSRGTGIRRAKIGDLAIDRCHPLLHVLAAMVRLNDLEYRRPNLLNLRPWDLGS